MKKSDLSYVICSVFIAMTAFFYSSSMWLGLKLPRYYPLEHTWKWGKEKGVPSQGWYAKQTFAFLTASRPFVASLPAPRMTWRALSISPGER